MNDNIHPLTPPPNPAPPNPGVGTAPPPPAPQPPGVPGQPQLQPSTPPPPGSPPPAPTPPSIQENPSISSPTASPADVKKSPIKKILILVLAVILLAVGGYAAYTFFLNNPSGGGGTSNNGSGSTGGNQTASITLKYWGLWEPSSVMQQVFSDFENQNPGVKIEYTQQSPKDYRERLQSALARGDGPDLFRYHNTWVPMLSKELDALPSSVMSAQEFQSTFYPVAVTDLSQGSSIYGIPLMIDGLGLYYNKTIFATAGKSPPKTWDELRTIANDLTVKNGSVIERAGIALGTAEKTDNFSDILALMFLQNGADPADPSNSLASDSLTFYTIFSKQDQVYNDTLPNSTQAFATEKAAMMIGPSWRAHEVIDINKDLEFAVVAVPQLPNNNVSWASYWVEGVSTQSQNKQKSWELLKYLSSKEVMRKLYTQASSERTFGELFSRVDLKDQLIQDPIVGAYIEQAPYAQSWPMASNTHDNGINDQIIQYYKDAVNQVLDNKSASKALETTTQGVVQVLSRYSSARR